MLLRYLSSLGPRISDHTVLSLIEDGSVGIAMRDLGVAVDTLGLSAGQITPAALPQLRSRLSALAPDVVHGWMYHGCLSSWAALAGRRARRPRLVWGIHHSLQDIRNEKRSSRAVIRTMAALSGRTDAITYCSDTSRRQHEAIGFAPDKSVLIPNAVNAEQFRPDPAAHAHLAEICGVPEGRLLIGNVARSHPMKDHPSMVQACAQLLQQGHDVQAVLIGEGHGDGPALAEAKKLGIADRVTALGVRDDIAALVPGLDVFLLCSAWGEAFPLAVTEAMAAGVPCVVTDVGDCAVLVGDTGIVVPPQDPAVQAEAVSQLISLGREGRQELGAKARERVQKFYSTDIYRDEHDKLYRAVSFGETTQTRQSVSA
ncbi:glycosyltransferase [Roseivivax sp. THAF197b]|uniref:glycosyltransferase n=1 Tax=Roseivivax sp. THAF197b TaxID=2588299 RepID=UPI0012A85DF7|nr:glycosyltransferase [Roseivivax sp. THAF197b]QFS82434.1 Putative glycosyltransferase EpsF [Roseivivax sp. THAF197b]